MRLGSETPGAAASAKIKNVDERGLALKYAKLKQRCNKPTSHKPSDQKLNAKEASYFQSIASVMQIEMEMPGLLARVDAEMPGLLARLWGAAPSPSRSSDFEALLTHIEQMRGLPARPGHITPTGLAHLYPGTIARWWAECGVPDLERFHLTDWHAIVARLCSCMW